MRDTNLRLLSDYERNTLYEMMQEAEDNESGFRAKIIPLKDEGYTVSEIRRITNHHNIYIRKWIHRFKEQGIEGIISKIHKRKPVKITAEIEKKIVDSNQKSNKRLWTILLNLVFKSIGRIHLQGNEYCR